MIKRTIVPVLLLIFTFSSVLLAQGPPPHAQGHVQGGQSDDKGPPFASTEKVMERFQKEFGVPADVFKKVNAELVAQDVFRGEANDEKESESGTEKIRSNTEIVLLLAIAQVNHAEKKGEMKKQDRSSNILNRSNQILEEIKKNKEGWGPIAMSSGFTDPGELLAIKRSIDWGKPIPSDLLKKMGM